jgi:hypothetical protein
MHVKYICTYVSTYVLYILYIVEVVCIQCYMLYATMVNIVIDNSVVFQRYHHICTFYCTMAKVLYTSSIIV